MEAIFRNRNLAIVDFESIAFSKQKECYMDELVFGHLIIADELCSKGGNYFGA